MTEFLPFSRALVTGGAGFVGSHIVDNLLAKGCDVVVLDDFSGGYLANLRGSEERFQGHLEIIKGDINDEDLVSRSLKDIEVIFHEAALVSVQRSIAEPELTNKINFQGTVNLLECAADSKVDRFVFASTAAIYGNSPVLPRIENTRPEPMSPYAETKLKSEEECMKFQKSVGIGTTVLRYFNIYGPRSTSKAYAGVINAFAEKIVSGQNPVVFGDGKQTRDFVSVEDIVNANILAASLRNSIGSIFNVGTGVSTTIEQLAKMEINILGSPSNPPLIEFRPALVGDVRHSYANITKIKTELKYESMINFGEGIKKYLDWFLDYRLVVSTGRK